MKLFIGLTLVLAAGLAEAKPKPVLINGRPANPGEFPQVVYISMGGGRCTATVVGPRAIITAAHCGETGDVAEFQIGQKIYKAVLTQAPLYKDKKVDLDLNLGLVDKELPVDPVNIGGAAVKGASVTLLGYGCTAPGGTGGNDGVLRIGDTKITGFQKSDMVLKEPKGAALCFGDSGGPVVTKVDGAYKLLGVNSKGNIEDTSYDTRLDIQISRDFISGWAAKNKVEVCGITKGCGLAQPAPTPPGPADCKTKFVELGQCMGFVGG